MASIDAGPTAGWLPAGQKLLFTLIPDEPVTDAYRYIVQVEENGTVISKIYLTPNPTETSFFDLSQVLTGRLEVDSLKYNTTATIHSLNNRIFTRSNDNIKRYRLKVGHFDGSSESLADDTSAYYYLFDGYEQLSQGLFPSFSDYYGTASTKKVWLSDRQPSNNVIEVSAGIEDNGVVAFINSDDTGSLITRFVINTYDTAGSLDDTIIYTVNATNGGLVPTTTWSDTNNDASLLYAYVYPASLSAITTALNAVTGGWGHYDVIPETATAQTGNILRIRNKCRNTKNNPVQLGWANTRGGWDYLRFDGRKLKTVTREEKTYRKQIGDYSAASFNFGSTDREITPYQVEAKEMYQLNGILTSEEYDLFQYCFRSKNIMASIDGFWVPVTLKESSLQVESDTTSKVYIATINVELAQILRC